MSVFRAAENRERSGLDTIRGEMSEACEDIGARCDVKTENASTRGPKMGRMREGPHPGAAKWGLHAAKKVRYRSLNRSQRKQLLRRGASETRTEQVARTLKTFENLVQYDSDRKSDSVSTITSEQIAFYQPLRAH